MKIGENPAIQYSAFALITVDEGDERLYLLQWNDKWHLFNLIGGKLDNSKGDNNSLARTIYRELEEELGLRSQEEFLILNQVLDIDMKQYSHRENRSKLYHFSVFEVDLFPRLPMSQDQRTYAARWLSTGRENIFSSKDEIIKLKTKDGRPISPTTKAILLALGELTPSQALERP